MSRHVVSQILRTKSHRHIVTGHPTLTRRLMSLFAAGMRIKVPRISWSEAQRALVQRHRIMEVLGPHLLERNLQRLLTRRSLTFPFTYTSKTKEKTAYLSLSLEELGPAMYAGVQETFQTRSNVAGGAGSVVSRTSAFGLGAGVGGDFSVSLGPNGQFRPSANLNASYSAGRKSDFGRKAAQELAIVPAVRTHEYAYDMRVALSISFEEESRFHYLKKALRAQEGDGQQGTSSVPPHSSGVPLGTISGQLHVLHPDSAMPENTVTNPAPEWIAPESSLFSMRHVVTYNDHGAHIIEAIRNELIASKWLAKSVVRALGKPESAKSQALGALAPHDRLSHQLDTFASSDGLTHDLALNGVFLGEDVQVIIKARITHLRAQTVFPKGMTTELATSGTQSSAATKSSTLAGDLTFTLWGRGNRDSSGTVEETPTEKPSTGNASLAVTAYQKSRTNAATDALSIGTTTKEYAGGEKVAVDVQVEYGITLRRIMNGSNQEITLDPQPMEDGLTVMVDKQVARRLGITDNHMPAPEPPEDKATALTPWTNKDEGKGAGTAFAGHTYGTLELDKSASELADDALKAIGTSLGPGAHIAEAANKAGKEVADFARKAGKALGNKQGGQDASESKKHRLLRRNLEDILSSPSVNAHYQQLTHGGVILENAGVDGILRVELVPTSRRYRQQGVFDLEEERNRTWSGTAKKTVASGSGLSLGGMGGGNAVHGEHDGTLPPGGLANGEISTAVKRVQQISQSETTSETVLPTISSVGLHADFDVEHEVRVTYEGPGNGTRRVVAGTTGRGLVEVHPWELLDTEAPAQDKNHLMELGGTDAEKLKNLLLDSASYVLDLSGAEKVHKDVVGAIEKLAGTQKKANTANGTDVVAENQQKTGTSSLTDPAKNPAAALARHYSYRFLRDSVTAALRDGYVPPELKNALYLGRKNAKLSSTAVPTGFRIVRAVHGFKPEDHRRTTHSGGTASSETQAFSLAGGASGQDALAEPLLVTPEDGPPPAVETPPFNGRGGASLPLVGNLGGHEDSLSGDQVADRNLKPDDELRFLVEVPLTWRTTIARSSSEANTETSGSSVYALIPARLLKEKGLLDTYLRAVAEEKETQRAQRDAHRVPPAEGTSSTENIAPSELGADSSLYDAAVEDAKKATELHKRIGQKREEHDTVERLLERTWADIRSLREQAEGLKAEERAEFLRTYAAQLDRLVDHTLVRTRIHGETQLLYAEWEKARKRADWSMRQAFSPRTSDDGPPPSAARQEDVHAWYPGARWVDTPVEESSHPFTFEKVKEAVSDGDERVKGDRVWNPEDAPVLHGFRRKVMEHALERAQLRIDRLKEQEHDEATRKLLDEEKEYFAEALRQLKDESRPTDPTLFPEPRERETGEKEELRTADTALGEKLRRGPHFTRRTGDGLDTYTDEKNRTYTIHRSEARGERLSDLLVHALKTRGEQPPSTAHLREKLARTLEEWAADVLEAPDPTRDQGSATQERHAERELLLTMLQPETGRSHEFTDEERGTLKEWFIRQGAGATAPGPSGIFAKLHRRELLSVANSLHTNAPLSAGVRVKLLAAQIRRGPGTEIQDNPRAPFDHPGSDLFPLLFARAYRTEVRVVRENGTRTYTEVYPNPDTGADGSGQGRSPVTLLVRKKEPEGKPWEREVSLLEPADPEEEARRARREAKGKMRATEHSQEDVAYFQEEKNQIPVAPSSKSPALYRQFPAFRGQGTSFQRARDIAKPVHVPLHVTGIFESQHQENA
jgi:hypothetical protein